MILLNDSQICVVRKGIIVVLLLGAVTSLWMVCSLLWKICRGASRTRRPTSDIAKILLFTAISDFFASSIKAMLKINDLIRVSDNIATGTTYAYARQDPALRLLLKISCMAYDSAYLWELMLTLFIFLVAKTGKIKRLPLCWVWMVMLPLLAVPLLFPYGDPSGHFFRHSVALVILMVNLTIVVYLSFIFSKLQPSIARVVRRTMIFPVLYIVFVAPHTIYWFYRLLAGKEEVHSGLVSVVSRSLHYIYIFAHCLAYGLSQKCCSFASATDPKQLPLVVSAGTRREPALPKYLESQDVEIDYNIVLGSGSDATVYMGRYRGTPVSVKQVELLEASNDCLLNEEEARFKQEAATLCRLRHPNIVYFMGAFVKGVRGFIVCEYCNYGSLRSVLDSCSRSEKCVAGPNSVHDWDWKYKIALDIARGLLYLHQTASPSLIHRDLKSLNVLINDMLCAKIGDFGTAKLLSVIQHDRSASNPGSVKFGTAKAYMTTTIGTLQWVAPEVLKNYASGAGMYTKAVDVFSFGIILWELSTCGRPFQEYADDEVLRRAIIHGQRPAMDAFPSSNPEWRHLMENCWADSPRDRPEAAEIVERLSTIIQQHIIDIQKHSRRKGCRHKPPKHVLFPM